MIQCVAGLTNDQASDIPSIIFMSLKTLHFYHKKNKLKQFLPRILQEIMEKRNTDIRGLVNDSFVPATQRTSVLY